MSKGDDGRTYYKTYVEVIQFLHSCGYIRKGRYWNDPAGLTRARINSDVNGFFIVIEAVSEEQDDD